MIRNLACVCCLTAAVAVHGPLLAAEQKPEDAVKMRVGFMQTQSYQLNVLKEVAKGSAPFDDDAPARARKLQQLSRMLPDVFATASGPDRVPGTNALHAVWQQGDELAKRIERVQLQVDRLVEITDRRDAKALDAQIKQVLDACKGCHKDFRKAKEKQ